MVLLIDDDVRLCGLLGEYLGQHGIALASAEDGVTGLSRIMQQAFDVVILDVMLPGIDGFEVLRQLRRRTAVPVIMLTARVAQEDRIQGLDGGADDYLLKPFAPPELLARIRALLRRGRMARVEPVVQIQSLTVDAESRKATVAGQDLELTSFEFDILDFLARAAGRMVSRDEMTRVLHQREAAAHDRSLDVHISRLRRKLERAAGPAIRTVRGAGYLLARETLMRSLYGRIFVAFFTTLVVSVFAFVAVFFAVTRPRIDRSAGGGGFVRMAVEANTAVWAWSVGGPDGLRTYLDSLNAGFAGRHYLVDGRGVDVLSGDDRSALLKLGRIGGPPRIVDGKAILIRPTADGRFTLVAELPAPTPNLTLVLPYFALLFGAIAGVCWLIAAGIASPVRRLAAVVERFGAGDMTARIHLRRRDELGDLASAYNKMADRIGVLLAAERQLLQDISHELRTPLARLNVGIELSRSAEDRGASADRLQLEAQRLTALVTSLIETTRAEGNLDAPEMEIVDLTALLRELSDHFIADAERRRIAIARRRSTRASRSAAMSSSCVAPWTTCCVMRSSMHRMDHGSTFGAISTMVMS